MNRAEDLEVDGILKRVAEAVTDDGQIKELGFMLDIYGGTVDYHVAINNMFGSITSRGTLKMLRDWSVIYHNALIVELLRDALVAAKLQHVADEHVSQGLIRRFQLALRASISSRNPPRGDTPGCATDKQLLFLATHLLEDFYVPMATELGFGYEEYVNIKGKHLLIKESTLEILHMWRNKTGGPHTELDRALVKAECSELMHKYKNE